ncbi:hypothetical protein AMECASPLE_036001 [Ameca splendens]|uniref:Uncharacterized protein n=1 Tax=Ameca splendens TaxID=208324 RepID=A0ABV0Y867_9TELE
MTSDDYKGHVMHPQLTMNFWYEESRDENSIPAVWSRTCPAGWVGYIHQVKGKKGVALSILEEENDMRKEETGRDRKFPFRRFWM